MRRRTIAIAVAVLMLFSAVSGQALGWILGNNADTPAKSSVEDDGMLRVYLKSLNAPSTLTLTLSGQYTVENDAGFRFDRDTRVILTADGNTILLTVGGLTIDMGGSMTLTRHAANENEENGIYIEQSEKDALFAGDLTVSAADGALSCILKIFIEDYLYGVVAYEMSDSFPLEALKAQAVAARTYAMGRKWTSAGRDYDVVDTTQDQVYKGYIADYTNVIAAVDATRGVVGMYNDGFAMCYYTASNGGQTALATDIWGGSGDYGYLSMADDPYDLENPASLINSIDVSSDGTGSEKLWSMLSQALENLNLSYTGVQLESIRDVEAVDPQFAGSYMYTKLRFTLNVSAENTVYAAQENDDIKPLFTDGAALDEDMLSSVYGISLARRAQLSMPFVEQTQRQMLEDAPVVELSVYEQIKDGLSLGLNGADYELVSVDKTLADDGTLASFTISMRRFGHGVGMSQRGAQWMAGQYAKDYLEILKFYYPGMSIEQIDWKETALSALGELPDSIGYARATPSPTPSPAPLPALESGEVYASVVLESKASTLNVRQQPSTSARIVAVLDYGQNVILVKEVADGWAEIRTAEISGYVKTEYLMKQ